MGSRVWMKAGEPGRRWGTRDWRGLACVTWGGRLWLGVGVGTEASEHPGTVWRCRKALGQASECWVSSSPLPCVTLGKSSHRSGPQFPHHDMTRLVSVASGDDSSSEGTPESHVVSKTNTHVNSWPGPGRRLMVPSPCVC